MINLSRLSRTLGLTLGATAGLAGVGILVALRQPLPRSSGKISVPGLRGQVQVRRDRWGVPHIYASNNEDLFAALGYVHAQDRLWQMELNRRTGHGQLAELFGPVALSSDRFVRTLGFSRLARRDLELLGDESHTAIEAYTRGVNGFLNTPRQRLPLEFTLLRHTPRPWEPIDVLVWGRVIALGLSDNWSDEVLNARIVALLGEERARELLPIYPDRHPLTVPAGISYASTIGEGALQAAAAAAPFINQSISGHGSNAWVVGGMRSVSGKPLLANDTHLSLTIPSIWYAAHLEGGDYAVTGYTFPGAPGVLIGHNQRIAWGLTNGMIDTQDLYIERFHPDDPLRYEWQGNWEQAELVSEEIAVKGQPPVTEQVRITRHGPLISSIAAPPESLLQPQRAVAATTATNGAHSPSAEYREELALRWTALEPMRIFQAVLRLNRARDWDEFRTALADWNTPPQNFVYADVDGHYGYALAGDVPIRVANHERLPVPGWSGAYEWQGYIPAAALPAAYDPPAGVVVTANNRIAGAAYAFSTALRGSWWNGYRAARIKELLGYTLRHDAQSFARIQCDLYSLPGRELASLLADLPLDDDLACQARDRLLAWNGDLSAESVGGAIYATLRYHLVRSAYAELGDLLRAQTALGVFGLIPGNGLQVRALPFLLERIAAAEGPERRDPWLRGGRTWNDVLRESLLLTVNELRERLGNDLNNWQYGRIHTLTLRHPLGAIPALAPIFNRGPWPIGGDADTVSMGYAPRDVAVGPTYNGPSQRLICDPSNWDASLCILPSGQSGHPGSRHYSDMAQRWRTGTFHPLLWSRNAVERHTIATLLLEPE